MKTIHGNLLIALFACASLFTISNASAKEGGLYAGVAYGSSTVDTGISNTTGTAVLDESDNGYKISFGKEVNKNFSIEAFYTDFGQASLSGNATDQFTADGTVYAFIVNNAKVTDSATGLGVNANFTHAFTDKSSVLARLGILSWDYTRTITGVGVSGTEKKSGADVFYGLGYRYDFSKAYALTIDYDLYEVNSRDLNTLSVGVKFNF